MWPVCSTCRQPMCRVSRPFTPCSTRSRWGQCHVQVCTNLSCTLVGAEKIVRCLEDRLGVKVGQTTGDRVFSLSEVECLGSCGTAPVIQVNDDYHEKQTPESMLSLIDELAKQA